MEIDNHFFFDSSALVDRLSLGLRNTSREVVFVVGAPLTAPIADNPGVDNVNAVINLIREEFAAEEENEKRFDAAIHDAENRYQAAFRFLQGRRGQDAANGVIRRAVLNAHRGLRHDRKNTSLWADSQLALLEESPKEWTLSPGVAALGELLTIGSPFSPLVVTSNFDPLLEVSIRSSGGQSWRTSLHTDGDFSLSQAAGCQVLHIHGFWQGTDTLHTGNQLLQNRPFLKNSLLRYLENKLVVVVAYGGWQDIFTGALQSLVSDASSYPEVLWCFYEQAPSIFPYLRSVLEPGIARNRVTLYGGVDCNTFFPELLEAWKKQFGSDVRSSRPPIVLEPPPIRMRSCESDRPPSIDAWVGRDAELRALEASLAKVVIISGIGGQGKSTLAAQYLRLVSEGATPFAQWDWRDCKEEDDRIRTQLVAATERMTMHSPANAPLTSASDADIVDTFIVNAAALNCVFVLDNVDSYVDLENEKFVGILDRLVTEFARTSSGSRIVITCRPKAAYQLSSVISIELQGLSLEETLELFDQRAGRGLVDADDVQAAHLLTDGHAIWLDMMAVQVGRAPGTTLKTILEDIRRGRGGPTGLLDSIWKTLPERERVVLRAMAETKRPEGEDLIARVVSGKLNFKNFKRALKSLMNLNLIVVKPERNSPDLYDLHPLVRHFVRMTFERPERVGFIKVVLIQYGKIIEGIGSALGVHLPFSMLERWSHKAELEIEAGMMSEAIATLSSAEDALLGGGYTEEFVRVARKLYEGKDWITLATLPQFDEVCAAVISALNDLEQFEDVDDMLLRYQQTISAKTARFIKFCDVKAYDFWKRGRFDEAIDWASRGVDLKKSSDVDTSYDCCHTLALAQRDGGNPSKALEYFIKGETLEAMIDPTSDSIEDYTSLGNVGRCLQMMGNHKDALVCFRKSARRLEADTSRYRLSNQAFAREWVAETLHRTGDVHGAYVFLADAEDLVNTAIPSRGKKINAKIGQLLREYEAPAMTKNEIRRVVSQWIFQ